MNKEVIPPHGLTEQEKIIIKNLKISNGKDGVLSQDELIEKFREDKNALLFLGQIYDYAFFFSKF